MALARTTLVYICDACHGESAKWAGQCPHCGEWNTLATRSPATQGRGTGRGPGSSALVARAEAAPLSTQVDAGNSAAAQRWSLGMGELDRVLGGGLVPGSVTLLGGEPGIGKSTLLLQVASQMGAARPVLYVSG